MTEYSSNFYYDSDSGLVLKFEKMLKRKASYFFDIEEVEDIVDFYMDRLNDRMAMQAVDHGLTLFPKASSLLFKKAHVLVMKHQWRRALKILDFLEASEPTNTELLLFKAVVHRNLSDHEGTKACLLKALESAPENREEIYLDLAYEQEIVNDFAGAIESLKESLKINPSHEPSLFELCYCFEMANDMEGGVTFFQNYLDEFPYNYMAWYNLGLCFEKLGLSEKALEAVDFALAIDEEFINGYIFRANIFLSMDQQSKAIDSYRDGLKFDPENPILYTALGECYERVEDRISAEANYRHALSFDPDFIDAIMGMGALREDQNNLEEALAYYEEAVNKDFFNTENEHILAETLFKAGRYEEAERRYRDLVAQDPTDEDAWIGLSEIADATGDFSACSDILREGFENVEDDSDLSWHLIKNLMRTGKHARAEILFHEMAPVDIEGIKYFLSIFPDAIHFPNIAALIEFYTQAQREDEF